MAWQVIISPSARGDLSDIVGYISRHNADAAARVGYGLIIKAEGLANFPELGRVVPEFRQPNLREIVYRSYRVIYRVQPEAERIEVVRFWHGARGFPQIHGII